MNVSENKTVHTADVCVVGGGMSGICAAVAAARHGAKVVLMQDRPMLGGNASSEVRMWIRGAAGAENRESGILQELEFENIYRNPTMNYSLWDTVLYQIVRNEENITLLLNCTCLGCETDGARIASVTGWQLNSYRYHTVTARHFIDCSGDSILGALTGSPMRVGREGKDEFEEYGAPETADRCTMGSSLIIQARQTDHPCPFIAPEWAYVYPTDESMHLHSHELPGSNFWWIEFGGENDTLNDAQMIGEELLKISYGVWDHLKNQGDHGLDNWELEWIGFLPGKRESLRYEGAYILSQKDLEEGRHFEDTVAYGGWTMDNHSPKGFYFDGYSSHHITPAVPYEIPLRCLYSTVVPNLLFAGRNISATHMALSSTRVMATCSVIGQAAGTAAAVACAHGCEADEADRLYISEVQQTLIDDGCYLPGVPRKMPDCFPSGLDAEALEILKNGWERPHGEADNAVTVCGTLTLLPEKHSGGVLRLALDPDFSRDSITKQSSYRKFAQRSHVRLDAKPLKMPKNMLRSCEIRYFGIDGSEQTVTIENNRLPLLRVPVPAGTARAEIRNFSAWGGDEEKVRLFACDIREE